MSKSKHHLWCFKGNPVERAQLLAALWQRPIVSDAEAAAMVGLPRSTWAALKRSPGFPAQFRLGRRVFFRVDDLRAWLDAKVLDLTVPRVAATSPSQGGTDGR